MLKLFVVAVCDVASGVLGLAGLIKLFDPGSWVTAIAALGVPVRGPFRRILPWLARGAGVVEIGIAAAVFLVGGTAAFLALAVAYAAFAVVSAVAWRRGGASCGCFGARSAPLSGLHVVSNSLIAVAALIAAVDGPASLASRLDPEVGAAVAYLLFAALGSAALVALMTSGAELVTLTRRAAPRTATPRAHSPHGAHR